MYTMQTRRALGSTELVILRCLCATTEASGKQINEYVSAFLMGMTPGHLYTTLNRLKDKELVASRLTPSGNKTGPREMQAWSVTDEGRAVYEKTARLFAGEGQGPLRGRED